MLNIVRLERLIGHNDSILNQDFSFKTISQNHNPYIVVLKCDNLFQQILFMYTNIYYMIDFNSPASIFELSCMSNAA